VTDEGGRNCHAAIIAREMRKPCVIATQVATSVLRDGMVVTVEGETGTVTVVSV
jgi:pyruvate,water dikinase